MPSFSKIAATSFCSVLLCKLLTWTVCVVSLTPTVLQLLAAQEGTVPELWQPTSRIHMSTTARARDKKFLI